MRLVRSSLLFLTVASAVHAATPRVAFERVLAAPVDLGGAEEISIVRAPAGAGNELQVFVGGLLDAVNHSGTLRATDMRGKRALKGPTLDIHSLECASELHEGEGGSRDPHGNRVRTKQQWVDARCAATLVVSTAGQAIATFNVERTGTSPRVAEVTEDERQTAMRQAARYAALATAERITPRKQRESINLDDSAPAFEAGLAHIEAQELAEARKTWERTLRANPRSAALHFNLAAVCEALGDRNAAARHYRDSVALAPSDERYAREMRLFQSRGH